MNGPQASLLPDGRRLHLNHGPIDLVIEAFGKVAEVRQAYTQAVARFQTILNELVAELPELRRPASLVAPRKFHGPTARRMEAAVQPLARDFITPMAAVAGSVADEILAALAEGRTLQKAYVNNGGDSALYLAARQSMRLAIAGAGNGFDDRIRVDASKPVRGIATSGWRGRSFSLGIADAVTVLARTGAEADAAATIIANAVDLPGHPAITRAPACYALAGQRPGRTAGDDQCRSVERSVDLRCALSRPGRRSKAGIARADRRCRVVSGGTGSHMWRCGHALLTSARARAHCSSQTPRRPLSQRTRSHA